ncbi:hypothetical protein VTL71DRAFT_2542, partial [Oculimacula yallundae]
MYVISRSLGVRCYCTEPSGQLRRPDSARPALVTNHYNSVIRWHFASRFQTSQSLHVYYRFYAFGGSASKTKYGTAISTTS